MTKYFILIIFTTPQIGWGHSKYITSLTANLNIIHLDEDVYVIDQKKIPYVINGEKKFFQANALIVKNGNEIVTIDTPSREKDTKRVLKWMKKTFGNFVGRVINTHFHSDSTGTNHIFKKAGFEIHASSKTANLLRIKGQKHNDPTHIFNLQNSYKIPKSKEEVRIIFPGATHAPDNVIVYFPKRNLLYGSCMIKSGNSLGNMTDANILSWQKAMIKIKNIDAKTVVLGHSLNFSRTSIDNTISLLEKAVNRKQDHL